MELRFPGRLALWRFAINSAAGKFLGADSVGKSRRLVSPGRSAAENSGDGFCWKSALVNPAAGPPGGSLTRTGAFFGGKDGFGYKRIRRGGGDGCSLGQAVCGGN